MKHKHTVPYFRLPSLRLLLLFQGLAFWPVWAWYVHRLFERCDEPWGLLPLLTAIVYVWRRAVPPAERSLSRLRWSALTAVAYVLTYPFVPALVRGGLAFTALCITLSVLYLNRGFDMWLWALWLMSLQVILTLEFYAGYPLRALATRMASALLRLGGLYVTAEGACLRWGERLVFVDAPCSGVKMLWAGSYLACTLAAFRAVRGGMGMLVGLLTVGLVVLGNSLRAAALFYVEAGIVRAPPWAHTGIGLVVFAVTAAGIVGAVARLAGRANACAEKTGTPPAARRARAAGRRRPRGPGRREAGRPECLCDGEARQPCV
ncbi:MAG: archaeosortase/exosortase family protein [Kiritimatiellae bacterium]|nr:archaeosortase/exosortase family protein [Kiritimatiellia bacterium]